MTSRASNQPKKPSLVDWHRIFGLALMGDFQGKPFEVEMEVDLSIQQQFLDLIILKKGDQPYHGPLPDGFDNLAQRNLISYKSLRETLDPWTLDELIGHYVNYRKQVSPKGKLLAQNNFQLYAVCTRFPTTLQQTHTLTQLQTGVYQLQWGSHQLRVIVLSRIPQDKHNALWNLFSNVQQKVVFGAERFQKDAHHLSTIVDNLFTFYNLEGLHMPYTMEDFNRDYVVRNLPDWLQQQDMRERLMPIMMNWLRDSPNEQIQAQLQRVDPLTQTRESLIKTIGRILRIRFQAEPERYRSRLNSLTLTNLDHLAELAETAQTLADFEAHLP